MAAESKSRLKGIRFGVRGSLFAAFAVIAGMAIVISAGAGLMLGRLGGTMVDLSGRDIPVSPPACSYLHRARASPARGRHCWLRAAKKRSTIEPEK
jgi:hypothetical protein